MHKNIKKFNVFHTLYTHPALLPINLSFPLAYKYQAEGEKINDDNGDDNAGRKDIRNSLHICCIVCIQP